MKQKSPKPKKVVTYSDAHNKAVSIYRKTSMFLLWAGVLSLFAVIIGLIQLSTGNMASGYEYWPSSYFAMSFSVQILICALCTVNLDATMSNLVIILTAAALGGGFAALGVFASKGKKWPLFIGGALYLVDFVYMFFLYNTFVPFEWTPYAFTLATHAVICGAIAIAIFEYYNVIAIEKRFKGKDVLNIDHEEETEVIAHGKNDTDPQ